MPSKLTYTKWNKLMLNMMNVFVEPKLMPECGINANECPMALTPPTHLRTLHKMMSRMVTAFDALGVDFVACAGTALGAVRHGGFIPWDDDADYFITREGFRRLLRKDVRKTLKSEYNLELQLGYAPVGVLKLTEPGRSVSNSPFIDLFSVTERFDRHKQNYYLAVEWITKLSLQLINPNGTVADVDRLIRGLDYRRNAKTGKLEFITKEFPWYDTTVRLPASGARYVKRAFGPKSLSHAVLRIYVPVLNESHKFRDIKGFYKLDGPLKPLFRAGKIIRPAAAGEIRTLAQYKADPKNPRYYQYYGVNKLRMLKKN